MTIHGIRKNVPGVEILSVILSNIYLPWPCRAEPRSSPTPHREYFLPSISLLGEHFNTGPHQCCGATNYPIIICSNTCRSCIQVERRFKLDILLQKVNKVYLNAPLSAL